MAAIQLERRGTESARDEVAIAVRGAVEVALVGGPHVVAADENSVWVWMIVEIHVLRLGEGRLHRVIAAGGVRRTPVCDRRSCGDVQRVAFLRELRVSEKLSALGLARIYLTGPAGGGNSSAGYLTRVLVLSLAGARTRDECGDRQQ